jgi:hypothetical protein
MLNFEIEATSVCNTHCIHCPREALTRPAGMMKWETYETILQKINDYTGGAHISIAYSGMGEPMLNPLLYKFVEHVSPFAETSFATNGSAATSKNIQKLIDAGLDQIWFSFNGSDAEVYGKMMGGLSFTQAHRNLEAAVQLCQNTRLKVGANVSITKLTQHQLAEIQKNLNDAGVESVRFSQCHNRGGFLTDPGVCTTPKIPFPTKRCDIFTHTIFVDWRGKVLSCCHDLRGDNEIGDLTTESMDEIMGRRQTITKQGLDFKICDGCTDIYRMGDDLLPDGKALPDWVYPLYDTDETHADPADSDLMRWLTKIYELEGRSDILVNKLTALNSGTKAFAQGEIERRERRIADLETEINAIRSSRTWKFLDRIKQVRAGLQSAVKKA